MRPHLPAGTPSGVHPPVSRAPSTTAGCGQLGSAQGGWQCKFGPPQPLSAPHTLQHPHGAWGAQEAEEPWGCSRGGCTERSPHCLPPAPCSGGGGGVSELPPLLQPVWDPLGGDTPLPYSPLPPFCGKGPSPPPSPLAPCAGHLWHKQDPGGGDRCPLPTLPRVSPVPVGLGWGPWPCWQRGGVAVGRRAPTPPSSLRLAQMLPASAWEDHKYLWPPAQAAAPVVCLQPPRIPPPSCPRGLPAPRGWGTPAPAPTSGPGATGLGPLQPPDSLSCPPLPRVPPAPLGSLSPPASPPHPPLCAGVSSLGGWDKVCREGTPIGAPWGHPQTPQLIPVAAGASSRPPSPTEQRSLRCLD